MPPKISTFANCIFLSIVRPANKIGEYAELGDVTRDKVKEDELEFAKVTPAPASSLSLSPCSSP